MPGVATLAAAGGSVSELGRGLGKPPQSRLPFGRVKIPAGCGDIASPSADVQSSLEKALEYEMTGRGLRWRPRMADACAAPLSDSCGG